MGIDDAKGRVKEAVGDLTDDKDLQKEGKADRIADKVKETVDTAKEKVEDLIRRDRN